MPGVGARRVSVHRRTGVLHGTPIAAELEADLAARQVRLAVPGCHIDGAVQRGLGGLEQAGPPHQRRDPDPARRVLGMHLGEGLVLEERQLGVAEPGLHLRELAPGTEIPWVQKERGPEFDPRLIGLARR